MADLLEVSRTLAQAFNSLLTSISGQVTAWTGLIRVDGITYIWMGNPAGNLTLASQTSFEYTSTRSIFKQNVNGQVDITATFLSPVTPDDYMRSSLISSYLQVEVASADGQEHDIQLYTDISAGKMRISS